MKDAKDSGGLAYFQVVHSVVLVIGGVCFLLLGIFLFEVLFIAIGALVAIVGCLLLKHDLRRWAFSAKAREQLRQENIPTSRSQNDARGE